MKTVKNLQTETKKVLNLEKSISSSTLIEYLSQIGISVMKLSDELSNEQYQQGLDYIVKQYSSLSTPVEMVEPEASLTVVPEIEEEIEETSLPIVEKVQEESEDLDPTFFEEEDKQPESTDLTIPQASEEMRGMVNFKAQEMGIQLASNQVDVIASQIDSSGQNFTQTLKQIENALTEYIDYQQSSEAAEVGEMFDRVTNRIHAKNQSTSGAFRAGVDNLKTALEVAEKQQKRELDTILARLKVSGRNNLSRNLPNAFSN